MLWIRAISYRCSVCGLPRLFIRRDHTKCLEYVIGAAQRLEEMATVPYDSKKYTPRNADDPERDGKMTAHAAAIAAKEGAEPPRWREALLFDLSDCPHTVRSMVEVENAHGVWGVEICVDCGLLVAGPECPHISCHWNEAGTMLQCDNCGIDGT